MKHEIKPSDVYTKECRMSWEAYKDKHQLEAIAFRPPKVDEVYVPCAITGFGNPVTHGASAFGESEPRFIVRRLDKEPSEWE